MEARTDTFEKPRLYALDLMRGIAALLVAIGHSEVLGFLHLGRTFALCVPFFFMLSGYVLEHAYGDAIRNGRMGLGRFAAARYARLYPLHLFTFAVVVLFWMAVALARNFVALPIDDSVGLNATPVQWFETLTLTHFLFGGGVAFNTPSWSISIELWCSFYLFGVCLTPRRLVAFLVLPILLVAFGLIEAKGGLLGGERLAFGLVEKTYLIGMFCFTIGWLLRAYRPAMLGRAVWWMLALITFAAVASDPFGPGWDALYYGAFALIIAGLAGSTLRHPTMAWAGDISYGVYLWHLPLILSLSAATRLLAAAGIELRGSLVVEVAFIAILLPLAWVSYQQFEVPAKRTITSGFARWRPARA